MLRRFSTLLLVLSAALCVNAQGNDFGMDYSLEATKRLGTRMDFSIEGEARTQDNTRQIERWTVGGTFGVKLYDTRKFSLKASAGWKYMWMYNLTERNAKYDDEDGSYTGYNKVLASWRHRHRTSVALSASYKPNKRWTFSLKETFQYTHSAEDSTMTYRYRLKTVNGAETLYLKDTRSKVYSPNDKMVLRSKLTVSYNIRHLPLEPFASVDYGCGLNYSTNKWKFTVGTDYKLLKKHKFTVFYRYITEDDDEEPNGHLIGLGYGFKF